MSRIETIGNKFFDATDRVADAVNKHGRKAVMVTALTIGISSGALGADKLIEGINLNHEIDNAQTPALVDQFRHDQRTDFDIAYFSVIGDLMSGYIGLTAYLIGKGYVIGPGSPFPSPLATYFAHMDDQSKNPYFEKPKENKNKPK